MEAMGESKKLEEEVARVVEQARELQESGSSLVSRISNEEQSLRQKANTIDSSIRRLRTLINSLLSQKLLDPKLADKAIPYLCICIVNDGDAAAFLPPKAQGRFLRMFLGPINVRASRKDVQLKVKEEYNSYRVLDLGRMLACISRSVVPVAECVLCQAWLLFLYTGLALRENILRANGSDIRPWWIYHHYCAMVMALVSLTWEIKGQPNCAQKQRGVELFLQWAMMQGVAMLLQNRYQRQRLYTRIALGKHVTTSYPVVPGQGAIANRMDVVWGETAGVDGQLWVLCPILFLMQGFEAYVGLLLLKTAFVGVVSEWQVIFCGILLVLMAIGNFINTVQTLMVKSRFKAKMKRTKSKQEF
ncbi:TMPIT-like protein [Corchorus olitorius]|uniref:TMPIT-like protein n=1 Tax=Corchorus olitorius TaxID=93759 RepID=A0A1R3IW33_9ROSI|nr:TMPIT-like protein [Corchorus olitorius]